MPGSSGREAHDEPELSQPLIVVVLVVHARETLAAKVAGVMVEKTGQAANMGALYASFQNFLPRAD